MCFKALSERVRRYVQYSYGLSALFQCSWEERFSHLAGCHFAGQEVGHREPKEPLPLSSLLEAQHARGLEGGLLQQWSQCPIRVNTGNLEAGLLRQTRRTKFAVWSICSFFIQAQLQNSQSLGIPLRDLGSKARSLSSFTPWWQGNHTVVCTSVGSHVVGEFRSLPGARVCHIATTL